MTEATTNTTAGIWPSATGILRAIATRTTAKGEPMATFKIEIPYKDKPGTFTKRCKAFGAELVNTLEALGEGTRIRARGPEDSFSFDGKDGKKVTLREIIAKSIEAKPMVESDQAAAA